MTDARRHTCEDVFRRLDDFLDRHLSDEDMRLVRAHLDACAQCAAEHRFEATVVDSVRAKLQHLQAPASLLARVKMALAAERSRPD